MTTKQLQLAQEIEQKFKELQETIDGDKYITAFSMDNNFLIATAPANNGCFCYYNGSEV